MDWFSHLFETEEQRHQRLWRQGFARANKQRFLEQEQSLPGTVWGCVLSDGRLAYGRVETMTSSKVTLLAYDHAGRVVRSTVGYDRALGPLDDEMLAILPLRV
jgi:hypothetical protein